MDPVVYEGIMSNPVRVFRRELEIQFRGSGNQPQLKLLLCCHAAASSPMSFWVVSTVSVLLFLSSRPQNFKKKGEK